MTNAKRRAEAIIFKIRSIKALFGISTGAITADIPKIKNILKILEPTTFPIAISVFFLRAATTEVANSGKDVPKETTVTDIILSEIPKFLAKLTAESTINLPPKTKRIKPSIVIPIATGRV